MATVAELCEQHQITLAQLVDRSGLEHDRVTAILQGRWTPSPSERQRIAAVFSVSTDEISWGHRTAVEHMYGHGPGGQANDGLRRM